ncbi:Protein dispatched -like protein 1 [Trichinella nelsoni]|uniref:Protein dispatched-like protein 1 n=1 Tax=Trichinella nelsoni TaxID=6336 RepID=A0A0V0RUA2_9BILA|nr:Protein dispatched -like protein 1 [Trichinella nelsoni]
MFLENCSSVCVCVKVGHQFCSSFSKVTGIFDSCSKTTVVSVLIKKEEWKYAHRWMVDGCACEERRRQRANENWVLQLVHGDVTFLQRKSSVPFGRTGLRSLWLSLHEPKRQLAAFFLRQRPTVLLALTNQEKERQCTMDTGVAAGRYAMFICNRPITVFMTTTFLLCTLTALGLELAPTPDFSDPKVGFETRGTVLSDRVLTWNNLEEKISFYPDSRKEFYRQMPPINILQRRKRNGTGQLLEELFFAALTSSPCLQLHAPLAQLEYHSLIVLEAPSTKSLFTVDVILELCKLQQQINATLQEVKIRLEQNHFWSLPNYITCFSGELTCTNLKEKDVGTVAANIERCAPYQQQIIHCKGSANTAACQAIPDYCNSKYYQDLFYFILSQNIFSNATGPVYTSMVLPIYSYNTYEYLGRRDVSLKKFAKLYEKVSEWQNDLKHLKLVGLNLGIKLQMFNSLLVNDTVWVFLGISLVAVIIWIYSGSFFYAVTVLLSMFFSVTVAYFVYGLVFRMEFFPFMNLLVIVLLIGIGADDTFVLKYVFDTSKKQGAKTIAPEDIVDALSYAALSMLITSVTTAAAFFSSLTSNVIVIKCFAVFAGTTMLMNYLLVVSFMPASLIILERYVNPLYERWCPKRLNALVVQAYASGAIASNFLMQICLPFVLQRLRAYVIAAFGLLLALSFFLVFYKPGLSLPKRNPILLFQPSHPFEWYDDQMELHFRFALARYCMPIKVSLVWGFVPSEVGGSHFDPFSYGQLAQDARFKANLETLRDLQAVCDRLAKEPAFNYDGDCFAHAFFKWSKQQVCVGEGESCCAYLSKYFDQRNVQPCVAAFTRTTDVFSGSPIIRYDNDAVVGFVIYLETRHNWTTDYDKLKHFQDDIESTVRRVLGESRTATLKRGWPVTTDSMTTSWYDLQKELLLGTPTSIILSILIAFIVAVCVTRTVVLSFLSILSISAVILDTIAVLVLLGWRLNVVESTIIILTIGLSFDYTLHYAVAYKFASLGSRDDKVMTVLKYIGVPVTLSALTTLLAGLAMLPSNVMAYTQIGFFMILMSLISWLNSSLCYLSLLAVWGPQSTSSKPSPPTATSVQVFETFCNEQSEKMLHYDKRKELHSNKCCHAMLMMLFLKRAKQRNYGLKNNKDKLNLKKFFITKNHQQDFVNRSIVMIVQSLIYVVASVFQFQIQLSNSEVYISTSDEDNQKNSTDKYSPAQNNSTWTEIFIIDMDEKFSYLGMTCQNNSTCASIPNSYCTDKFTCQCRPNFLPRSNSACILAPTYGQICSPDLSTFACRPPFVCNSNSLCDCPQSHDVFAYGCLKRCQPGYVAVKEKCFKGKQLNESCEVEGQCLCNYCNCKEGTCQCIEGAELKHNLCTYSGNSCLIGQPAVDENFQLLRCSPTDDCPEHYICTDTNETGICCPAINCPVGEALLNYSCHNCPSETHFCHVTTFGVNDMSLCCPKACPSKTPVYVGGKCFPTRMFGQSCEHTMQCSTWDAICEIDADHVKKCLCKEKKYNSNINACVREAQLGDSCNITEECVENANIICLDGRCQCYPGYIEQPVRQNKSEASSYCILKPVCPTKNGFQYLDHFVFCEFDDNRCSTNEYCRINQMRPNETISVCCPKPTLEDFEALCAYWRMHLYYENEEEKEIFHCTLQHFDDTVLRRQKTVYASCPPGSHCIWNYYNSSNLNDGLCCTVLV